jgi:hypothetical protein
MQSQSKILYKQFQKVKKKTEKHKFNSKKWKKVKAGTQIPKYTSTCLGQSGKSFSVWY